jgi:flagellar hook-basal body complex protein FliE
MTVIPPIDSSFSVNGPEWQIQPLESPSPVQDSASGASGGSGFGDMLAGSIQSLSQSQDQAAGAAQALATGQATDPTSVVMAVERAQLAMQLAGQIRNKAVEAAQEIFHTQV